MKNPLLNKLQALAELSANDRALIAEIISDVRSFGPDEDIIREKDRPDNVHLVIEGWASRYQILADGAKQITAFLLPGDFCDTHITLLGRMDHSIGANMACRVAFVSEEMMLSLFDRPAIARALWWASLVDEGIMRAWLVNLGSRDGLSSVAHLICEIHARLTTVEMVKNDTFIMPLTQEQIGQALGLTAVHVNRMLKLLRDRDLVAMRRYKMTVTDLAGLRDLCNFDPGYLHLIDKRCG